MDVFRNRVLLGLLVGALLLSAGLNVYFLRQLEAQPLNYELEAGLTSSVTEMELAQTRSALAACQQAHNEAAAAPPPTSDTDMDINANAADTVALRSPGNFLAQ